jgi:hypothetical protein
VKIKTFLPCVSYNIAIPLTKIPICIIPKKGAHKYFEKQNSIATNKHEGVKHNKIFTKEHAFFKSLYN